MHQKDVSGNAQKISIGFSKMIHIYKHTCYLETIKMIQFIEFLEKGSIFAFTFYYSTTHLEVTNK